jgi:hypothetical protein
MRDVIVSLPDGREVTFPDGTPEEEMRAALESLDAQEIVGTKGEANVGVTPPKSVGGWLGNVGSGLARLPFDAAEAVKTVVPMATAPFRMMAGDAGAIPDAVRGGEMLRQMPGAVAEGLKQDWGSPGAIAERAYSDPVGMAADVSTVLGGAGALMKVTRVPRLIQGASKVSAAGRALDPAVGVTKAVEWAAPNAQRSGSRLSPG